LLRVEKGEISKEHPGTVGAMEIDYAIILTMDLGQSLSNNILQTGEFYFM
jgi:hypothetical protein